MIGRLVLPLIFEFFGVIIGILVLLVIITYFFRGIWWVMKFFWKDQMNWIEGEMKRMWNDRPFQRRPRRPYYPAEFAAEGEAAIELELQQRLAKIREARIGRMNKPSNHEDDEFEDEPT